MLILRLFLLLAALLLLVSGTLYVFTRDPRYLRFLWQVVRFVVLALLVFGLLFVLERYVLTAWRVLL